MAQRSALPHFLTALYALLIVHASLQPFTGWLPPLPETPFYLWAPWPRFNVPDFVINFVAYMPLGLAATWMSGRDAMARTAVWRAIAGCALLSFAMESTQMYLPVRRASAVDLLANVLGASFGALAAAVVIGRPRWRQQLRQWREQAFIGGRLGDFGLTLLALWWVVHVNPAIVLFAATFQPDFAMATDTATTLLEGAQTALNFVGVLLFVALLLRRREYFGLTAICFIGASLALKAGAALLLLKPAAWDHWLRPGATIGIAVGALVLFVAVWLPRRPRMIVCAVALLSSLLAAVLMPDLLSAQSSIGRFHWHYGQLLNFNGLTRTVLLVWPLLAALHLLLLYGRRD
ncbi:MAG: VanZ family protein [Betaproteobacteria bacterium]